MTAGQADGDPVAQLDLRGTPCPLNFIRSRLALERLLPGETLQVDLDAGEPEQLVSAGLAEAGHAVASQPHPDGCGSVRLLVRCAAGPTGG